MSVGSKIYGAYMRQDRTAKRGRKKSPANIKRGNAGICPFTLEAVKDCVVLKKTHRTVCLFSLEGCMSHR